MMIWIFNRLERPRTQFVRVAPNEIRVFLTNFFSRQNEIILWGKKRTTLFQTWERSSFFFNALTDIRKYVTGGKAYIIFAPSRGK